MASAEATFTATLRTYIIAHLTNNNIALKQTITRIMKTYFAIISVILVSAGAFLWLRQNKSEQVAPSLFDTIVQEQPLEMTITTDLSTLLADRAAVDGQPALINWTLADGSTSQWQAEAALRGKTRRQYCEFPPLKLNFDSEQLRQTGLQGHSSLKLVTQCTDNEQLLLKEYLAYKMLNSLTDKSFRVQLARVTYRDREGDMEPITHYAIILENTREMAQRLGGTVLEGGPQKCKQIDAGQYRLITVFQYMIGNTDWNLGDQHNIKLVQLEGKSAPTPVPYDFDYAGLVNAPYAKPHPQMPINRVTERFFQYRGKDCESLRNTLEIFKAQKAELFQLCHNLKGLSDASRRQVAAYLESFFEIIENDDSLAVMLRSRQVTS